MFLSINRNIPSFMVYCSHVVLNFIMSIFSIVNMKRDWQKAGFSPEHDVENQSILNENYVKHGAILIPGMELLYHIQPQSYLETDKVSFAVDIDPKFGISHYAGKVFHKGDIYGCALMPKSDNEYLMATFGYVVEDNVFDMMQYSMKNSLKSLSPKLQSIAKVVLSWEEGLSFEEAISRPELYFNIRRDSYPNNRLMNYIRLMQLQQINTTRTADDLLSMYRNATFFSPENEKRALSSYYIFLNYNMGKYPMKMAELRKMLDDLTKEKEETLESLKDKEKESSKSVESLNRRIAVVQYSIGMVELHYLHMRQALLKLGAIEYVKLENAIEFVAKKA